MGLMNREIRVFWEGWGKRLRAIASGRGNPHDENVDALGRSPRNQGEEEIWPKRYEMRAINSESMVT